MRISLLACLLLAGCAQHKTTYLPDGRQGHSISCGGSAVSWNLCYEKAGEICKARGYDVISKEGDQSTTVSGTQYGVYGGTNVSRTLLIACK
jgi:hypothetical protein